jgi:hypothetical protein
MWQQFMARNEMVITAHPPYSPDLAPSGFYLFGPVKNLFMGLSFETGALIIGDRRSSCVPRKVHFDQAFSRVDDEIRAMYRNRW